MASYKRLKGLAHNVVHYFLSLTNYDHGQYIVEDLFQSARSAGAPHVTIDLLSGVVEPEAVRSVRVLNSVENLQGWLRRWATVEGCDPDAVRAFVTPAP